MREAVAIETNLGDPDLLPPPPSIRSSLGAVLRSPREAFIVFSAWVGVIASVVAAAVPLVLEGRGACGYAIAIRLCCIFAGTHARSRREEKDERERARECERPQTNKTRTDDEHAGSSLRAVRGCSHAPGVQGRDARVGDGSALSLPRPTMLPPLSLCARQRANAVTP